MALQNTSIFGRRLLGAFGAAGLVLALAACSGLPTAPIQPVRYDLGLADLGAQPASAAAPATALTPLVLAEVQTPGLPDGTTAMFYRLNYADSQQLRAYQNARWGLPPAQMMEQRLRIRLGQERPILTEKDNVSATVSDKRTIGVLRVEIDEFSQVFDSAQTSQAVVRLRASLIGRASGGAGNALLSQKVFTAQTPAASNDAAGGAQAMARSVDDVTAQVSRWLQGYGR
ncbi:MAG: ABC-type transport auxiliary lipoprotein family protein [Comamonas sp.]|uniref:ABC-type transport auxiliary lipoprotein family protein n=1 Tax=Comamonas sp. lk TaxID=2201272 RepID=UPI000EB5ABB0|nr:ABC-type transport auxiliary lipoprotein family protein [Comamonas sp. lk]